MRFASEEQADRWRHSDERCRLLDEILSALQHKETIEIHSGIDDWFTDLWPREQER